MQKKKKTLEDFRNDFGYPKLNMNPSLKIRTHLLLVGIYIFVLVLSTSDRNCLICLHSILQMYSILRFTNYLKIKTLEKTAQIQNYQKYPHQKLDANA